jgi:hypothetical protein
MIPTLSEPLFPPGAPAPGLPTQPGAALRGGGGGEAPDFAGLLSAAIPEAVPQPPASLAALPGAAEHVGGPLALPGGTILPDIGTGLPHKPGGVVPVIPLPFAGKGAGLSDTVPEAASEVPTDDLADPLPSAAPDGAAPVTAPPVADAPAPAASQAGEAELDDESPPPTGDLAAHEPFASVVADTAPVPAAIAALIPVVQPGLAPATTGRDTAIAPRAAVRSPAGTPVGAVLAGLPQVNPTADLPFDPAPAPAAGADPAPDLLALEAEPAAAPASQPAPAPASAQVPAAPALVPSAPIAERAEPRAPAVNQESAIAAVGEIREALRAARPELTLRHADFGFVSLRVESTGAEGWRAVLASRDPGFVPAIQTALAERAVAAASDTASTNTGQNGTSDQRYGASPNGRQGSSQPYLGHSHSSEQGGSAHPHSQRQPSTTDAVAGRAGAAEAERPDPKQRGVFA